MVSSTDSSIYEYPAQLACKKHGYFATAPAESILERKAAFLIHDRRFSKILGDSPILSVTVEDPIRPFAHEAGVYIPATGDVFITSSHLVKDGEKHVQISRVFPSHGKASDINGMHQLGHGMELVHPEPNIIMANGGVNYRDGVLFCEQGNLTEPGGLTYMDGHRNSTTGEYTTTNLLSSYYGRWFNSVNDIVVHANGSIWFTDPPYGYEQGIRPVPQLPAQTYRFDPSTGNVRAVEDSLKKPNGLCFSPDQRVMYITDTAGVRGATTCPGVYSRTGAASVYAFDVVTRSGGQFLTNKRLFAFADRGIPDGIECDRAGNVYSGCGDGVHVWAADGTLIGKIVIPGGCANFCFGQAGELFLLNERQIWRVQLAVTVRGDLLGL
ncbi:gluconolactonase precursor [Boeremia exigua]|uniref:gluconolactonase precursor n=1 Tax=Boeremia exigua TaxID=749465 RepID=UPI001E8CFD47|nr:gluconolactonase precursor [Boeremia exigua]KAH6612984.1 gluconolactonase precursor [Boeremia exigua]